MQIRYSITRIPAIGRRSLTRQAVAASIASLEMLANVNLGEDLRLLAPNGRVIVIGSRGSVEIDPRDAMMRDADIRGMVLPNASAPDLDAIYKALGEHLADDRISPVVGRSFPLASAAEAHRAVMAPNARGKIVLIP